MSAAEPPANTPGTLPAGSWTTGESSLATLMRSASFSLALLMDDTRVRHLEMDAHHLSQELHDAHRRLPGDPVHEEPLGAVHGLEAARLEAALDRALGLPGRVLEVRPLQQDGEARLDRVRAPVRDGGDDQHVRGHDGRHAGAARALADVAVRLDPAHVVGDPAEPDLVPGVADAHAEDPALRGLREQRRQVDERVPAAEAGRAVH